MSRLGIPEFCFRRGLGIAAKSILFALLLPREGHVGVKSGSELTSGHYRLSKRSALSISFAPEEAIRRARADSENAQGELKRDSLAMEAALSSLKGEYGERLKLAPYVDSLPVFVEEKWTLADLFRKRKSAPGARILRFQYLQGYWSLTVDLAVREVPALPVRKGIRKEMDARFAR